MKNIVVLGIGNRLMMDDAIGLYTVEILKELSTEDIHYVIGETDIYYCMEEVKEAGFLIVIDAVKLGKESGEVTAFTLDDVTKYKNLGLSMHNLNLFDMVKEPSFKSIKGILIGVEPYMIDYNLGLSKVLSFKLPEILCKIKNIINYTTGGR